jgi:hypothetical protein
MLFGLSLPALAGDPRPAGYIMGYELKGADLAEGTVVVRHEHELPPKLLMPLYDGDAVFIRDEESRITLSLAQEDSFVVSGKLKRKEIAGEMPDGDDGVDIIKQIVDILFDHRDGDSVSVLVAKGDDEMKAPLAVHGRNHILRNGDPLLVSWTGGEGPFSVRIEDGKGGKAVTQAEREIEILPARISGSKFAVIVMDARQRKLRVAFDLRTVPPEAPEKVEARERRGEIEAVWLAAQQSGAWRFEAVRQLKALPRDKVTDDLIAALEKGWQPK